MSVDELPDDLFAQIEALCHRGDDFTVNDEYQSALDCYKQAWDLIPDPKEHWSVTLWLLETLGDVHYLRGAFLEGRDALTNALAVFPEANSRPFLCLRLGQCYAELGNEPAAIEWLRAAEQAAGEDADELFDEEDPKYLALLNRPA